MKKGRTNASSDSNKTESLQVTAIKAFDAVNDNKLALADRLISTAEATHASDITTFFALADQAAEQAAASPATAEALDPAKVAASFTAGLDLNHLAALLGARALWCHRSGLLAEAARIAAGVERVLRPTDQDPLQAIMHIFQTLGEPELFKLLVAAYARIGANATAASASLAAADRDIPALENQMTAQLVLRDFAGVQQTCQLLQRAKNVASPTPQQLQQQQAAAAKASGGVQLNPQHKYPLMGVVAQVLRCGTPLAAAPPFAKLSREEQLPLMLAVRHLENAGCKLVPLSTGGSGTSHDAACGAKPLCGPVGARSLPAHVAATMVTPHPVERTQEPLVHQVAQLYLEVLERLGRYDDELRFLFAATNSVVETPASPAPAASPSASSQKPGGKQQQGAGKQKGGGQNGATKTTGAPAAAASGTNGSSGALPPPPMLVHSAGTAPERLARAAQVLERRAREAAETAAAAADGGSGGAVPAHIASYACAGSLWCYLWTFVDADRWDWIEAVARTFAPVAAYLATLPSTADAVKAAAGGELFVFTAPDGCVYSTAAVILNPLLGAMEAHTNAAATLRSWMRAVILNIMGNPIAAERAGAETALLVGPAAHARSDLRHRCARLAFLKWVCAPDAVAAAAMTAQGVATADAERRNLMRDHVLSFAGRPVVFLDLVKFLSATDVAGPNALLPTLQAEFELAVQGIDTIDVGADDKTLAAAEVVACLTQYCKMGAGSLIADPDALSAAGVDLATIHSFVDARLHYLKESILPAKVLAVMAASHAQIAAAQAAERGQPNGDSAAAAGKKKPAAPSVIAAVVSVEGNASGIDAESVALQAEMSLVSAVTALLRFWFATTSPKATSAQRAEGLDALARSAAILSWAMSGAPRLAPHLPHLCVLSVAVHNHLVIAARHIGASMAVAMDVHAELSPFAKDVLLTAAAGPCLDLAALRTIDYKNIQFESMAHIAMLPAEEARALEPLFDMAWRACAFFFATNRDATAVLSRAMSRLATDAVRGTFALQDKVRHSVNKWDMFALNTVKEAFDADTAAAVVEIAAQSRRDVRACLNLKASELTAFEDRTQLFATNLHLEPLSDEALKFVNALIDCPDATTASPSAPFSPEAALKRKIASRLATAQRISIVIGLLDVLAQHQAGATPPVYTATYSGATLDVLLSQPLPTAPVEEGQEEAESVVSKQLWSWVEALRAIARAAAAGKALPARGSQEAVAAMTALVEACAASLGAASAIVTSDATTDDGAARSAAAQQARALVALPVLHLASCAIRVAGDLLAAKGARAAVVALRTETLAALSEPLFWGYASPSSAASSHVDPTAAPPVAISQAAAVAYFEKTQMEGRQRALAEKLAVVSAFDRQLQVLERLWK